MAESQRSNEWYDQEQQLAEATKASLPRTPQFQSHNVMSLEEHFEAFRSGYSNTSPSYNSGPTQHSSLMTRSLSHGNSVPEPNLALTLDPQLTSPTHAQNRHVFSPSSPDLNMVPQRVAGVRLSNTSSLAPPQIPLKRSRSQEVGFTQLQGPTQLPTGYDYPAASCVPTPWMAVDAFPATSPTTPPLPQGLENGQSRRCKKARTVAGPDLRMSRMKDFALHEEVQPVPQDVRRNQVDILGVGSNTAADNLPLSLPRRVVTRAPESSPNVANPPALAR